MGRPQDLDVLVTLLQSPEENQSDASKAASLKALSRLPADALSGNDPPQLAKLRELRTSAAQQLVAQAEAVLQRSDAKPEDRVRAVDNLGLDTFDNQKAEFAKLLGPQESEAVHAAVLAAC